MGGSSAGPASNAIAGLNLGLLVAAPERGDCWYAVVSALEHPGCRSRLVDSRTEPEVFMEPENTGGAFNTDSIAWKFRLVYGGDVIDHRGAVRFDSVIQVRHRARPTARADMVGPGVSVGEHPWPISVEPARSLPQAPLTMR